MEIKAGDLIGIMKFIRGEFLEPFTLLEFQMNEIIRKTSFDSEEIYDRYMGILGRNNLQMHIKLKLFEICLDKFQKHHSLDISDLRKYLEPIVQKRNYIAHCPLDVSNEGIDHFKRTKKLRLLIKKDKKDGSFECVEFEKEETQSLVALTETLTKIIILMNKAIDSPKP